MPSKDQIKASLKEGGKKGQDLAGMADMGGVRFFSVAVESCEGDFELLDKVMEGMNTPVDEAAEERKGGADDIGKMLLSASKDRLAIICHVPESRTEVEANEWLKLCLDAVGGGEITPHTGTAKGVFLRGEVKANPDANRFPLKDRDTAISASFAFLRAKGLVMDDDDDDIDYGELAESAGVEW